MTRLRSILFGDDEIRYSVTRSARRKKTITITLHPSEGVIVAAPLRTPNAEIEALVRKRAGWILRKLGEERPAPQAREFASGESLPYLGREVPMFVQPTDGRAPSVRLDGGRFLVECPKELAGEARRAVLREALISWYKDRAEGKMRLLVERWQSKVGAKPARIAIGNQKTRWGSCSSNGNIRFNCRLLMAPPGLIDYVIVHELCHLLVANHSDRFWEQVSRTMPDYEERRRRLREIEPTLDL